MRNSVIQILSIMSVLSVTVLADPLPPLPDYISVQVPFEFHLGNKVLPAGGYLILQVGFGLQICLEGIVCEKMPVTFFAAEKGCAQARLAFHRYGDENFLSQVWVGGYTYQFSPSQREGDLIGSTVPLEVVLVEGRSLL